MKPTDTLKSSRSVADVEISVAWVTLILFLSPTWFSVIGPQVVNWYSGQLSTLPFLTGGVGVSAFSIIIELMLINYAVVQPLARRVKEQKLADSAMLALQAELADIRTQLATISRRGGLN